jgi:hypothetical protein
MTAGKEGGGTPAHDEPRHAQIAGYPRDARDVRPRYVTPALPVGHVMTLWDSVTADVTWIVCRS